MLLKLNKQKIDKINCEREKFDAPFKEINQLKERINESVNFKSMEFFIKNESEFIKEIEAKITNQIVPPKDVEEKKDDLIEGSFIFKNYKANRLKFDNGLHSEPIYVDGVMYWLDFYPNGWEEFEGSHLCLGIEW